jgi:tRNA-splicing ligase RtcB
VAYRDFISPSGVGYDIGCGNKAVQTNLRLTEIARCIPELMDEIVARISFGVGRANNEPVEHLVLDHIRDAPFVPQRRLREMATRQLGTVGAGNHHVDLFADEDGWAWVGVHFGSRGFGRKTASGLLALAAVKVGPVPSGTLASESAQAVPTLLHFVTRIKGNALALVGGSVSALRAPPNMPG